MTSTSIVDPFLLAETTIVLLVVELLLLVTLVSVKLRLVDVEEVLEVLELVFEVWPRAENRVPPVRSERTSFG